jgi:hypothetical protein
MNIRMMIPKNLYSSGTSSPYIVCMVTCLANVVLCGWPAPPIDMTWGGWSVRTSYVLGDVVPCVFVVLEVLRSASFA